MNIPPTNDLNRDPPGPGFTERMGGFFSSLCAETFTWTDAKDLALRFAVPLFGIAATAIVKAALEKREKKLKEAEEMVVARQQQLDLDRKIFESQKGVSMDKPLDHMIDELLAKENSTSFQANKEIDALVPMIKEVLKIRCSPLIPRNTREPLEKRIRERLLHTPSPLDQYSTLKQQIHEDVIQVYKKDIEHCDFVWPIGNDDNGELYKVYAQNWRLRIELEKYKHIIEQLKKSATLKRSCV